MASPHFIYLHGFASSPASTKAKAFRTWAEGHGFTIDVLDLRLPSFEHLLFSAMEARVRDAIDLVGGERVALIGSSLGGLTAARVAAADPRVCSLFLMAPAFDIAARWESRIGKDTWERWKTSGYLEVDDYATRQKARVHWGFIDELARIDAARGVFPDVRVPTHIVHGVQDDVVSIELSRAWSKGKPFVELVEVDDGHELGASIPRLLDDATTFFSH